jgi:hypothetical protein
MEKGSCFDISPDASSSGTEADFECAEYPAIHLVALRQGLYERLLSLGTSPRFGFAGEISCTDSTNSTVIDGAVRVQDVFKLRISREGQFDLLVARHRSALVSNLTLANLDLSRMGTGISATRLRGEGPPRGEVLEIQEDKVLLLTRSEQIWVNADEYLAALNAPTIVRAFGAATYRNVLVASESLTANGRRNRYVVKRRFEKCREMFGRIGKQLNLPDNGCATIEEPWVGVELQ